MTNTVRVAAAQFHVGNDVDANLQTCLRMLSNAAENKPQLIVLPEFCNHCSWYDDADHCFAVSVDLDGPFMTAIAERVREIGAYVSINCTVRRANQRVTGTSIMLAPDGEIIGTSNKQVLIGHENDFLDPAVEPGPVVETPVGRLGMYSCMDGVINETPRCLALRGAQVLCNNLNSFAVDEGALHIPVRAAENKVWVVAANKVGPLIPTELVGPVSEATAIPAHFLDGAGDSQVVAPDGTVLAKAGRDECCVFADIDPQAADNKTRPDGRDLFATRRPAVYAALGEDPTHQTISVEGPEDVVAAAVAELDDIDTALQGGAELICLASTIDPADIQDRIGDGVLVAAPVGGGAMVLVSNEGVLLSQAPVHVDRGAREVDVVDTVFGRIAVMTPEDAIYPELMRLPALRGASTVLIAGEFQEAWEGRTGLVERAAENRLNIVFASSQGGEFGSLIAALQKDFTIMTEWQNRPFDGLLSCPVVHRVDDGESTLIAEIHPLAAGNKECSRNTHLLASRPWQMLQPILDNN